MHPSKRQDAVGSQNAHELSMITKRPQFTGTALVLAANAMADMFYKSKYSKEECEKEGREAISRGNSGSCPEEAVNLSAPWFARGDIGDDEQVASHFLLLLQGPGWLASLVRTPVKRNWSPNDCFKFPAEGGANSPFPFSSSLSSEGAGGG